MFKRVFEMLFYENGSASLTKILTVSYFVLFSAVTVYLVCTAQNWLNYDIFATIAGGGGATTQVANKFINSKYNTAAGSFSQIKPEQK